MSLTNLCMCAVNSRAVNSKSSVISSVTGRIWFPAHGKGLLESIIKESVRCPVTEKLPTELFFRLQGVKMRQIINNIYLLFLRIMNLASFFVRTNILIFFF